MLTNDCRPCPRKPRDSRIQNFGHILTLEYVFTVCELVGKLVDLIWVMTQRLDSLC